MALDLPQQLLAAPPAIMPFLNTTDTAAAPLAGVPLQLNNMLEGIRRLPNVSYNGLGIVPQMGWCVAPPSRASTARGHR